MRLLLLPRSSRLLRLHSDYFGTQLRCTAQSSERKGRLEGGASMQAIENSYLAARLDEHGIREPILEIGAGWQPDFHQKPFRERGATRFFTQEVAVYDNNPADFVGDLSKGTEIPEAF